MSGLVNKNPFLRNCLVVVCRLHTAQPGQELYIKLLSHIGGDREERETQKKRKKEKDRHTYRGKV